MTTTTSYADNVLKIEPYGIEAIPLKERHGKASQVFTFWFSANLNILTWFTGTLGILLGLSFIETVGAIVIGNIFGTLFLAITSSQGPRHGLPQIAASAHVFGPLGLKLFGTVNWLSNVGWFAVDQISFCTTSSDYSRYLYPTTSPKKIAVLTFFGSALAGIWLEVLGAAVTSLNPQADPITLIVQLMGLLAVPSMLTIALSTIPINVLAIYSGGMSLLAAGIPLRRWGSALLTGGLGILLISSGSEAFADTYKNFLLLLSYWITPWLGIFLSSQPFSNHPVTINPRQAIIIYLLALLLSIPFMASTLYTGYITSSLLGGADASYLVSLFVSFLGVRWLGRGH